MARSWGNARATFEGGVAAPRRGCENVFGARSSAIASPDHCILVIYLSNDLKPLSINLRRLKKRKKKKRKKVKMPKTWVVAKDTPVTVLWNYDLFAAEGHWSWPFPEACCLPRSQETGEYIYICIYVHSHDFEFRGVKNSRWYSTVGIFSRWLTWLLASFRKDSYSTRPVSEFWR